MRCTAVLLHCTAEYVRNGLDMVIKQFYEVVGLMINAEDKTVVSQGYSTWS